MYSAAAIAMFLPLLDLHCGNKSCDLTEKKFADNNKKFTDANTKLETNIANWPAPPSSAATQASVDTIDQHVDDIKAKTDNLPADTATDMTAIKAKTDNLPADTATDMNAIKTKTDNLPADTAAEITAIKTAVATKKYIQVAVALSNGGVAGDSFTVADQSDSCHDTKDKDTVNHVMCCKIDQTTNPFALTSHVEVDHYALPSNPELTFVHAENYCTGAYRLCNESDLTKIMGGGTAIMGSSGSTPLPTLAASSKFITKNTPALTTRADTVGATKVWTGMEC